VRRPKAVWVNTGLAVLLAGAGLSAYLSIGDPPRAETTRERTATAAKGTLTATVTGTGNAVSASQAGVNFAGSGGTLTAVYVKPGQKVTAGQKLARIDDTSAQQTLQTAQAQLASAQAQYDQTVGGGTAVQRQKDRLAVEAAQLSLRSANGALDTAKQQLATDTVQQNQLVAQAQAGLRSGTGTQAQVTQAEQTRANTLARDRQAITQAQQQVAGAKNQLAQQKLSALQNQHPTAASIAQAKAVLNSARVSVAQARKAVDQTQLTAPQAGTVISVSAEVGQTASGGGLSSGSTSGSLSGGSSGSGAGSGSASSSGGSGGGSGATASGSSSGSSSSFIVIADLTTMTVTANITEADAAAVKVGQEASVTFPATGTSVPGKVTQIALSSITSNNVVQYPVTVTLQNVPDSIRLGATATVSITTSSVDDVLYVPSGAVTSLGPTHTVTVIRGSTRTVVPVRVGLVGNRGTQILSGLSAGDVVALPQATSTSTSGGFPRLGGGLGGIGGGRR
jgi:multidrug efflux pump subunit AcrA (membrane-fusion protein)